MKIETGSIPFNKLTSVNRFEMLNVFSSHPRSCNIVEQQMLSDVEPCIISFRHRSLMFSETTTFVTYKKLISGIIIQHIDTLPKYGQKILDVRRST